MTKAELVSAIAEKSGLNRIQAKDALEAFVDCVTTSVKAGDEVRIVGFGSFGEFRAWPCYRHSVEHSIHVRCDRRGQGVGRTLLSELKARAGAMSKHVMIAGIDADNHASIHLHESLGFMRVGQFHEVGFKFGRWLDLVFLQCILPATKQ